MRLAYKVIYRLIIIMLVMLVAYAFIEVRRERKKLEAEAASTHLDMFSQAIPSTANSVFELNKNGLVSNVTPLFSAPTVKNVKIFDENGRLLFGMEKPEGALKPVIIKQNMNLSKILAEFKPGKPLFPFNQTSLVGKSTDIDSTNHLLSATLWYSGQGMKPTFVGHAVLEYTTNHLGKRMKEMVISFVTWTLILNVIKLLATLALLRSSVLKPIEKLAEASSQIASGRFVTLNNLNSNDEIGILAKTFNNMVNKLKAHLFDLKLIGETGQKIASSKNLEDLKNQTLFGFSQLARAEVRLDFFVAHHIMTPKDPHPDRFVKIGSHTLTSPELWEEMRIIEHSTSSSCYLMNIRDSGKSLAIIIVRTDHDEHSNPSEGSRALWRAMEASLIGALQNIKFMESERWKIKVENDLEAAKAIQSALLRPLKSISSVAIETYYQSADQTGGDWYGHYYDQGNKVLYLFIGDVTGHGVPSALVTGVVCGTVQGSLKAATGYGTTLSPEEQLGRIVETVNEAVLESGSPTGRLMTMVFLAINLETGQVNYLNSGHNHIFMRQRERARVVTNIGSPLGYSASPDYTIHSFFLEPHDILFLYTDGLIENHGPDGKVLKAKNLSQLLSDHADPKKFKEALLASGKEIWQQEPAKDDCSFVIFQWLGSQNQTHRLTNTDSVTFSEKSEDTKAS